MGFQVTRMSRRIITMLTIVEFFLLMFPRMCLQVLRVGRPVIAMLTLEQFPEMVYEVCDAVSAIVALGALETLGRDLLHLHQGNEWKR